MHTVFATVVGLSIAASTTLFGTNAAAPTMALVSAPPVVSSSAGILI